MRWRPRSPRKLGAGPPSGHVPPSRDSGAPEGRTKASKGASWRCLRQASLRHNAGVPARTQRELRGNDKFMETRAKPVSKLSMQARTTWALERPHALVQADAGGYGAAGARAATNVRSTMRRTSPHELAANQGLWSSTDRPHYWLHRGQGVAPVFACPFLLSCVSGTCLRCLYVGPPCRRRCRFFIW